MSIATKCTCGHSLTGACTGSVKECRQLKKEKTQLPVEVVNEINAKAIEIALKFVPDINSPGYRAIKGAAIKGATAYASKLHQLDEHFKVMSISCDAQLEKIQQLQQENAELRRQNEKMKAMATGWRPLLEEVLKHDAAFGELSIEMIDKIKKFLYGE